jgi:hypothetical protein
MDCSFCALGLQGDQYVYMLRKSQVGSTEMMGEEVKTDFEPYEVSFPSL